MKLLDLDPRWLIDDGKRVGFIFRSPIGPPSFYQSCFVDPPERREQWALFQSVLGKDAFAPDGYRITTQGCNPAAHWQIAGGIEAADFATISVTPSLDGSAGGGWHGYITGGQIDGGI